MDDTLQKLYQAEIQLQRAARLATLLSLFIVLLGILGLVSLNVTQRTREIGIRKVLGSSTLGIVNLFLKEFIPHTAAGQYHCLAPGLLSAPWLVGPLYLPNRLVVGTVYFCDLCSGPVNGLCCQYPGYPDGHNKSNEEFA